MTPRIPEFVRHDEVDPDRIMVAAWLYLHGDRDVAMAIARSVVPVYRQHRIEHDLPLIAELLGQHQHCEDNPADFANFTEGRLAPPVNWTWEEWGDEHCGQLAADARVRAWQLAQHTDRELSAVRS